MYVCTLCISIIVTQWQVTLLCRKQFTPIDVCLISAYCRLQICTFNETLNLGTLWGMRGYYAQTLVVKTISFASKPLAWAWVNLIVRQLTAGK